MIPILKFSSCSNLEKVLNQNKGGEEVEVGGSAPTSKEKSWDVPREAG